MITFNPALAPTKSANKGFPVAPLDPLTASIIRLAAHISYPYSLIASQTGIVGLDVLSPNWRILSASVCLAFAFAEAIAGAPLAAVKQQVLQADSDLPSRRAITATEEETHEID
jgi:hypothetical protein